MVSTTGSDNKTTSGKVMETPGLSLMDTDGNGSEFMITRANAKDCDDGKKCQLTEEQQYKLDLVRRRNLARACGVSASAHFHSINSSEEISEGEHSIDSAKFSGHTITYGIEGQDFDVTRLSDGAYDIKFDYYNEYMTGGDNHIEVQYYCSSSYDKDTDSFRVVHTDEAGTKVVRSSTVSFVTADNIVGYNWKIVSRESDDDDFNLYKAFLEENSQVSDYWRNGHAAAWATLQSVSGSSDWSLSLKKINRDQIKYDAVNDQHKWTVKVQHVDDFDFGADTWYGKVRYEDKTDVRRYTFFEHDQESNSWNALITDNQKNNEGFSLTASWDDNNYWSADGWDFSIKTIFPNDKLYDAYDAFWAGLASKELTSDEAPYAAVALLYDQKLDGERHIDRHLIIAHVHSEDETRTVTINFPTHERVYFVTKYDGHYTVTKQSWGALPIFFNMELEEISENTYEYGIMNDDGSASWASASLGQLNWGEFVATEYQARAVGAPLVQPALPTFELKVPTQTNKTEEEAVVEETTDGEVDVTDDVSETTVDVSDETENVDVSDETESADASDETESVDVSDESVNVDVSDETVSVDVSDETESVDASDESESVDVSDETVNVDVSDETESVDVSDETVNVDVSDETVSVDVSDETVSVDVSDETVSVDVSDETVSVDVSDETVSVDVSDDSVYETVDESVTVNETSTESETVPVDDYETVDETVTVDVGSTETESVSIDETEATESVDATDDSVSVDETEVTETIDITATLSQTFTSSGSNLPIIAAFVVVALAAAIYYKKKQENEKFNEELREQLIRKEEFTA